MHPYFGKKYEKLQHMGTSSSVFSFTPINGLIHNLKHFGKVLDLSEIDPTHELYSAS